MPMSIHGLVAEYKRVLGPGPSSRAKRDARTANYHRRTGWLAVKKTWLTFSIICPLSVWAVERVVVAWLRPGGLIIVELLMGAQDGAWGFLKHPQKPYPHLMTDPPHYGSA